MPWACARRGAGALERQPLFLGCRCYFGHLNDKLFELTLREDKRVGSYNDGRDGRSSDSANFHGGNSDGPSEHRAFDSRLLRREERLRTIKRHRRRGFDRRRFFRQPNNRGGVQGDFEGLFRSRRLYNQKEPILPRGSRASLTPVTTSCGGQRRMRELNNFRRRGRVVKDNARRGPGRYRGRRRARPAEKMLLSAQPHGDCMLDWGPVRC